MREIKFRAWDAMAQKMEPVGEITFDTGLEVAIGNYNGKTRSVNLQYQPHIILMQYTGLHDKNGRKIYEGDIMRTGEDTIGDPESMIGQVIMREGSWLIENEKKQEAIELFSEITSREVIGNIFNNPELLEAEK